MHSQTRYSLKTFFSSLLFSLCTPKINCSGWATCIMHWSPAVRVCMVIIKSTKGFFIPEVPGANCSTFQYVAHTVTVLVCLKSTFGFFFLCVGHEYPYGIKMSHLRDTALLAQGSKDSPTPSNLQEPFLTEQLPREMQCQFILKPSRLAVTQQLSGEFSPPS